MKIFALHGFLGLPSDWNFLSQVEDVVAIDILAFHSPRHGLWSWSKKLNAHASKFSEPKILLGYSMGARLAMHALLDQPTIWQRAIFVSGNAGLKSQKLERKARDEQWAKRFLDEPWEKIMAEWDQQKIFQGSRPLPRYEQDYSRKLLAEALVGFSLGIQDDLSAPLKSCSTPQLRIIGEYDSNDQSLFPHIKVPQAGHRVPWDASQLFIKLIKEFANGE